MTVNYIRYVQHVWNLIVDKLQFCIMSWGLHLQLTL